MDEKELINLTLDFYKYKVNSDSCTMEELRQASEMLQRGINCIGTVEDFSKFCDIPESHVRNIISRKVLDKPKRRVYYKFIPFLKNIPANILKKKELK